MGAISRKPTVMIQKFSTGASVAGVTPVGGGFALKFSNYSDDNFELGETIAWGANSGVVVFANQSQLVYELAVGVNPAIGDTLTGATSGATCVVANTQSATINTGELIERGRQVVFFKLSNGGLFEFPVGVSRLGFRVVNALVNLPGITAVKFKVVDQWGADYGAGIPSITAGEAYQEFRNGGLLVPPNCKFKVVGTGTLSGAGQIMLILGQGWSESAFSDAPELGKSNVPPGMQRPA